MALMLSAAPAFAHHEAMFGPQSSAVLSPGIFLSALVFDKETGKDDLKRRETTTVYSVGFKPMKKQPLSMAFVLPVTFAGGAPDPNEPGAATRGFEDMLISARYRVEAPAVANALGVQESYVMGVGGVELPSGTFDHPFGKGAFGQIAAGLFSLEKRPFAMISYVYYHHRGVYEGVRDSGNTFAGGGLAYTPIDDEADGKLFSLQLGVWYRANVSVAGQRRRRRGQRVVGRLHPSRHRVRHLAHRADVRPGVAAVDAAVQLHRRSTAIQTRHRHHLDSQTQ